MDILSFPLANLSGENEWKINPLIAILRRAKLFVAIFSADQPRVIYLLQAFLRRANLSGADLRGANFSKVSLFEAQLIKTNLSQAHFNGATFRRADLTQANLSKAHLKAADFYETRLIEVNLRKANLTQANLTKAQLNLADFNQANLRHAKLIDAKLVGADFSQACLENVNFGMADLIGANLSYANLSGASFFRANLSEANLKGANLQGVDFRGAELSGANLSGANLSDANLSKADLSGANLTGANLTGAKLIRTQALAANFEEAMLTGACLEDWNINGETNLNYTTCLYIYLKEHQQDRRPHVGEFAPGEFTQLFQKALETVDLIFRDGVNWKAFAYSLANTQVVHEELPLAIRSIENKGDGTVLIKVGVTANTDKGKIDDDFWSNYELVQEALEKQYQARIADKNEHINQLFDLVNHLQKQLGNIPQLMAQAYTIKYDFYGSVTSVGNEGVQGNLATENQGCQKNRQDNHVRGSQLQRLATG
ncbi:MAG: pentapeptide repeat-containing protein [Coleofasciculus chthonoplastes F3-SA18-01]|uniref:pentapeptide repeat-containing protein n=1 Tax=Coleofasciculus chthonoplastes TaxID=64178 RepID=UPI0032F3EE14